MVDDFQKPITVVRGEFITNLARVINDSMLQPFIIESILKDAYLEIKDMAERQYRHDEEQYQSILSSCSEQCSSDDDEDDDAAKEIYIKE